MKKLLSLIIAALALISNAFAESVTYDTADVVGSIQGLGTAAIAIMGAAIVVAITIMVYRKIKGLAARG